MLVSCFLFLGVFCLAAGTTQKSTSSKAVVTKKPTPSVAFNGKKFYLQYSVGNSQEWLNEYLPAGQNFNNYTEMIAVRYYDGVKATPGQIAQLIAGNYAKAYPGIKYMLASNEKTGDGLVSYIMIESNILEHNLFRTTTKDGTPVSVQYVYRKYLPKGKERTREDLSSFAKETNQYRTTWINALEATAVPAAIRTVKK